MVCSAIVSTPSEKAKGADPIAGTGPVANTQYPCHSGYLNTQERVSLSSTCPSATWSSVSTTIRT